MVAKIKIGKSIVGVLNYNEQKVREHKAECIGANLFGREVQELTFRQKASRFIKIMELNPKTKTNTLHISLNFDPSENPSKELLMHIAEDYMSKLGFSEQPFLVYKHNDAGHPHIHLVSTNIKSDGSRIDLHNIGSKKSETARKEIEETYHLVKASHRGEREKEELKPIFLDEVVYGKSETKRAISNLVSSVLASYKVSSMAEFNAVLSQYNIMADRGPADSRMYLNKGLNYFILDKKGRKQGVPIKASSIYQKPTLPFLKKYFEKCKLSKQQLKKDLKDRIYTVISGNPSMDRQEFLAKLKMHDINAIFYTNEQGITFGLTFIDNCQKVAFTGSDLGKDLTAKAIIDRLTSGEKFHKIKPVEYLVTKTAQTHVIPIPGIKHNGIEQSFQNTPELIENLMVQSSFDPSPSKLWKRKKKRKRVNL